MIEALYVLAIIVSLSTRTTAYYRASNCSNITFAPNSTYETNLNHLLSSLSSNHTSFDGSLFYNTTVGQSPGTDIVYGSFLCRGDLPPKECQACVARVASEVTDKCPNRKEAVVWYDECMLQYANESFFGRMREYPGYYLWNHENVSIADQGAFDRLVGRTMMEAVDAASSANNRFATREANFSAFHSLYSTAQCTPDISSTNCAICLSDAVSLIPKCCAGKKGGRVLFPSCNVRYESYRFYRPVNPAAPNPAPVILPSAPPESAIGSGGSNDHSIWTTVIAVCVPIGILALAFLLGWYWLKRRRVLSNYNAVQFDQNAGSEIVTTVESLQYDLGRIQAATNNFSNENKLGEGGFGAVYKGVLSNGLEIAVKRLSKSSLQGVSEFKNEILLVAKLQHRNLTRLLGFCLEEEEKILVYEFVPNKSLDFILYDRSSDSAPIDWSMRYKIIGGIARGVLYLHEDSRLKIIHRDLKASNVLLDEQMIPKISDFGMAKLCGVDESHGNTSRIVGTYGYMSPEYAFYGQFSVKSDVYSFGVLIIEIVTGKKCTRFLNSENSAEDLLSFAWKHWTNRKPLELVDPRLGDSYTPNEVTRCVHIGLLCVQEDPDDRPTMATVVLMLSSFSVSLPLPKQPAFFPHSRTPGVMPLIESESEKSTSKSLTINEMSMTETFPR